MPTYQYICECGYVHEDIQPMPDRPTKPWPQCGKEARKRVGPGAGIIFKGSGFYATDYRKKEGSR